MMRILLVDDQPAFRTGLRTLLSTAPGIDIVGEAENGEEGATAAELLQPDVILMDVRMPVVNGVAATAAIRARNPSACILMLTTFEEDETVAAAMRAGASGYLLKGTPLDDMLQILALAVRGYTALAPGITHGVVAAPPASPDDVFFAGCSGRTALLSGREREILELIAQGFTNREVAQQLFLTEGTVKNYVSAILGTLGLRHRTEAAILWRAVRPMNDL